MARIQSNGRTGKGDRGTSNLFSGWTIRKSHSVCALQNEIEALRNDFSRYLLNYPTLAVEDNLIFQYHKTHLNTLCALVYFKFNNLEFAPDLADVEFLEDRLAAIASFIQPAKDFIIPETQRSLDLDDLRVQVRKVEHLIWVVVDELYGEYVDEYNESVKRVARQFNTLSDYLYSLNRHLGLQENQVELYWAVSA